jgi:hypothetical protein
MYNAHAQFCGIYAQILTQKVIELGHEKNKNGQDKKKIRHIFDQ